MATKEREETEDKKDISIKGVSKDIYRRALNRSCTASVYSRSCPPKIKCDRNGPDRVYTLYGLENLNTVYVLSPDRHGKGQVWISSEG